MGSKHTAVDYDHKVFLNGIHGFVRKIENQGEKVRICGWNSDHWNYNTGDTVLFVTNEGTFHRYKFDYVEHCGDPDDMYFAECSYFPW